MFINSLAFGSLVNITVFHISMAISLLIAIHFTNNIVNI